MRYSGEPGHANGVAIKKRNPNAKGVNPCLSGDTLIETIRGKYKIGVLAKDATETNPRIVVIKNGHGVDTMAMIWKTGVKKTITLKLENGDSLTLTQDHKVAVANGEDRYYFDQAKNTFGEKLLQYDAEKPKEIEVIGIEWNDKEEDVYDFTTADNTHTGIANGYIVHNCGEILLDNKQNCNLTTVNCMAFVKDGEVDKEAMKDAFRRNYRAGFRMTNVDLELPEWSYKLHRDRLTGVSPTGWQDMINATGMSHDEEALLLRELRDAVDEEVVNYSKETGLNATTLSKSNKPSGSLSLLPDVSAGIHYPHSEYFIRRVRISADDPLVMAAEELGWVIKPEVGQTLENCTTKVIEFPCKAPAGKTKFDVTAIEQLENYKRMMDNFVDHNVSITVSVRENEWDDVEEWVWNHWDEVVALSFLPLNDAFYELAPYEKITKEEYEERSSKMKRFVPSLISKYEREQYEHELEDDPSCSTGACPVR